MAASPTRRSKERSRLSYYLRSASAARAHCAGVNALCVSPDGARLFTASRDATARLPLTSLCIQLPFWGVGYQFTPPVRTPAVRTAPD